jgi:hypothetical protein
MSGKRSRNKGARVEREIVDAHKKIGVHAERVPLSGGTHYQGNGHDIDIYPFGLDAAPLVAEVKARQDGQGFALLERWIDEYDALFLKRNNTDLLVVLPWRVWRQLLDVCKKRGSVPIVQWTDGDVDQGTEAGSAP